MWSACKVNIQTINEQHTGDTWPFLKSTLESYHDVLQISHKIILMTELWKCFPPNPNLFPGNYKNCIWIFGTHWQLNDIA